MDENSKAPIAGRTLRRLRAQFRRELLGAAKPTPSDMALIDLAAQAMLRVREMRAEIVAGNRVPDEDLVRLGNLVTRVTKEFRGRAATKVDVRSMTFDQRMAAFKAKQAAAQGSDDDPDFDF